MLKVRENSLESFMHWDSRFAQFFLVFYFLPIKPRSTILSGRNPGQGDPLFISKVKKYLEFRTLESLKLVNKETNFLRGNRELEDSIFKRNDSKKIIATPRQTCKKALTDSGLRRNLDGLKAASNQTLAASSGVDDTTEEPRSDRTLEDKRRPREQFRPKRSMLHPQEGGWRINPAWNSLV